MSQIINSVELESIKLISFSFNIYDSEKAAKGGSVNFGSNLTLVTDDDIDDKKIKNLISDIVITAKSPADENLFKVEARYSSSYLVINGEMIQSLSDEKLADLCLSLIYTTIRDDVMHALSRGGLRQITLPLHVLK